MRSLAAVVLLLAASVSAPAWADAACPAALDAKVKRLVGPEESLCQYAGKVVLVVNTASHCGFAPQFEGLEKLYRKYRDRGFVVLGFPSPDFGDQEFKDAGETAKFCKVNYGVSFPMFAKSHVVGPEANPVFRTLAGQTGSPPAWNFHKYLIGLDGHARAYVSDVTPEKLDADVAKALAAR